MPLGARPLKPFPNASSAPTNWEQGSRLRATEANYLKSFVISRLTSIIGNNVIISTCYVSVRIRCESHLYETFSFELVATGAFTLIETNGASVSWRATPESGQSELPGWVVSGRSDHCGGQRHPASDTSAVAAPRRPCPSAVQLTSMSSLQGKLLTKRRACPCG